MALLTAEDVLNKAFSKTKYREGFDQDEVDDFLDEVANTIAGLTAERDELQQRLAQAQAGGSFAPTSGQASTTALAADPHQAEAASATSPSLLQAATDPNPPSATTMLAMAQKLHDEYLQAGEEARDRLIDEGKAKAETIVEQAQKDAQGRLEGLEDERADLERRIDDLRRFERDYRGHLRNYLENLLGDLEHNASKASAGPLSSSPTPTPQVPSAGDDKPATPEAAPATQPPPTFGEPWGGPTPAYDAPPSAPTDTTEAAPADPHKAPAAAPMETAPPAAPADPFDDTGFPQAPPTHQTPGSHPGDAPRWNF